MLVLIRIVKQLYLLLRLHSQAHLLHHLLVINWLMLCLCIRDVLSLLQHLNLLLFLLKILLRLVPHPINQLQQVMLLGI